MVWPTLEQQKLFGELVERKNSLVKGRWGFIDGKNYRVQKPSDAELQNAMYNGWLHCTLITGVFCYTCEGVACWGKHNFVGSWNDGDMSRPFQNKLGREDINLPGHGVLSDSAFPVSGDCFGRIMTPLKEGDLERVHPDSQNFIIKLNAAVTQMRQPAEWGMGSAEKVYRRLLIPLPYNPHLRQLRLKNIYRLYNFRVRRTGISEIKNYFFD
jgi:hypothetical protein